MAGEEVTARASSLPIAESCGFALELAEKYPESSVYSIRGDAFHAGAAAAETRSPVAMAVYRECLASLDELTRSEIVAMVGQWLEVRGDVAPPQIEVEMTLALDQDGVPCPEKTEGAIVGHGDACWIEPPSFMGREIPGAYIASVLDHKTGQERPYELQLGFYALAYAALKGATHFRYAPAYHQPGQPPRIVWSPIVAVDSPEAEALWQRVLRAANRKREPVTGPHCTGCFQRLRCRSWMLPAVESAHEALRPMTMEGGGLTKATAPRALRIFKSMGDVMKIAKAQLESYADANNGIFEGEKVWLASERQGRETIDVEAMRRDGIPVEKYARRGAPYSVYDWRKVK